MKSPDQNNFENSLRKTISATETRNSTPKGCLTPLLLVFAFFGIFFGTAIHFISKSQKEFMDRAVKIEATIQKTGSLKSCKTTSNTNDRNRQTECVDRYFAQYEFSDKTGIAREGKSQIEEKEFALLKNGDRISVFYDPNNPSDSRTRYNIEMKGVPFGSKLSKIMLSVGVFSLLGLVVLMKRASADQP